MKRSGMIQELCIASRVENVPPFTVRERLRATDGDEVRAGSVRRD